MDLSKFTEMDLLNLRHEVNEELKNYENREKKEVFVITVEGTGNKYFIEKKNAIKELKDSIKFDELFENKVTVHKMFIDEAQIESYCEDFTLITQP